MAMTSKDRFGLAVAPIFLRLAVGATFLWAGSAKILVDTDFAGDKAAALANLGVDIKPTRGASAPATPPAGGSPRADPIATPPSTTAHPLAPPDRPLPPAVNAPTKSTKPANKSNKTGPNGEPSRGRDNPNPSAPTVVTLADSFGSLPPAAGVQKKPVAPVNPSAPPAQPSSGAPAAPSASPATAPASTALRAADFPSPVSLRRLYLVALEIQRAANPPADAKNPVALWPARIGTGMWPVYLAWAVALTELLGGLMVLIGMLTRFWAFSLVGVMLGAMWLDQIGPAIWAGNTVFGIIPAYTWWDPALWHPFILQGTLASSAMALVLLGSGAMALDNAMAKVPSDSGSAPARG